MKPLGKLVAACVILLLDMPFALIGGVASRIDDVLADWAVRLRNSALRELREKERLLHKRAQR